MCTPVRKYYYPDKATGFALRNENYTEESLRPELLFKLLPCEGEVPRRGGGVEF
jgi:hypothetical protein